VTAGNRGVAESMKETSGNRYAAAAFLLLDIRQLPLNDVVRQN
jgi:hypothetical protein